MLKGLNREQIHRAEMIAERLEARRPKNRIKLVEALAESREWSRPRNLSGGRKVETLATRREQYTFSDEQFRIALASLERQGK